MYALGVPIGMFVDHRGPRPAVLAGSLLLGLGYWPLQRAYDAGQGSVAWLSFVSFLTGLGGCTAFAGAVKTSAINWPTHRGTATAFPIAAFGLSAFFFSVLSSVFFPGSPGKFLLVLSIGTFGMTFIGFFFLRVFPHTTSPYHAVPADSDMADSRELHRTSSQQSKLSRDTSSLEPGTSSPEHASSTAGTTTTSEPTHGEFPDPTEPVKGEQSSIVVQTNGQQPPTASTPAEADETCSLLSRSSTSSLPGEVLVQSSVDMDRSHRVDIRGWKLLKSLEFWQFFAIMALLSGIGLMTIK